MDIHPCNHNRYILFPSLSRVLIGSSKCTMYRNVHKIQWVRMQVTLIHVMTEAKVTLMLKARGIMKLVNRSGRGVVWRSRISEEIWSYMETGD